MDDMKIVREFYGEAPPAPQLQAQIRTRLTHPPRRRALRRPALGLGLVAAGAAAAIAVSATGGAAPNPGPPPAAVVLDGSQILLAAASTAESAPASSGTYWHVKTAHKGVGGMNKYSGSQESWTDRRGDAWVRIPEGVVKGEGVGAFNVADKKVTFAQLQNLPTDPAALTAWIARAMDRNDDGTIPPSVRPTFAAQSLASLLADTPAPPKVRAAAYRALAAMPGVKNLGILTDPLGRTGQGLRLKTKNLDLTIIIDPKSSRVLSTEHDSGADGVVHKRGTSTVETAEWTSTLPKVIPVPKPTGPARG